MVDPVSLTNRIFRWSALGWFAFPVVGDEARTAQWAASLVSFCVLIVIAMFMVTRPVHLPALPRWQSICMACLAVLATVVAAFWPHPAAQAATTEPGAHTATLL